MCAGLVLRHNQTSGSPPAEGTCAVTVRHTCFMSRYACPCLNMKKWRLWSSYRFDSAISCAHHTLVSTRPPSLFLQMESTSWQPIHVMQTCKDGHFELGLQNKCGTVALRSNFSSWQAEHAQSDPGCV
ncbi:hypothetical protein ABBQ38_011561 [Trebouxia sp. C0009 RCD-2024]